MSQRLLVSRDWTEDRRGSNKRGITPDFVPEEYVAESILPGWEIYLASGCSCPGRK